MLTVTGPGFSASSCSRPPAANRVRGACWACAARWCCSGACSVQDGRGSSRTSSSSSDFTVLHKFAADVLLEGNASFLLLCLFRRDGMTEQQDGWRGEDGGGGRGPVCLDRTRCYTTSCDPDSAGASDPEHPEGSQTAEQTHKHAHSAS